MSESPPVSTANEAEVQRQVVNTAQQAQAEEINLKLIELDLRRRELEANIAAEQKKAWHSSSILVALVSAIFGLLGTGIGAVLQGYNSTALERQKFEAELIKQALEPEEDQIRANNLLFLAESGLITGLNIAWIRNKAENDKQNLPVFPSVFNRGQLVLEVQQLLQQGGYYSGPLDGVLSDEVRVGLIRFQRDNRLEPDGIIGPLTLQTLREVFGKK